MSSATNHVGPVIENGKYDALLHNKRSQAPPVNSDGVHRLSILLEAYFNKICQSG
jgi:hypothetical protein